MTVVTLKGSPMKTIGELPVVGMDAPDFGLTDEDLSNRTLSDYAGKKIIMNIFPSIDTPVCSSTVRRFNEIASKLSNSVVLCISMDLPFAQKRFCGAEGLDRTIPLSDFRTGQFAKDYGVMIMDGPLRGLMARAIIIVDDNGSVLYTQQVDEISEEPDYDAALDFV